MCFPLLSSYNITTLGIHTILLANWIWFDYVSISIDMITYHPFHSSSVSLQYLKILIFEVENIFLKWFSFGKGFDVDFFKSI